MSEQSVKRPLLGDDPRVLAICQSMIRLCRDLREQDRLEDMFKVWDFLEEIKDQVDADEDERLIEGTIE